MHVVYLVRAVRPWSHNVARRGVLAIDVVPPLDGVRFCGGGELTAEQKNFFGIVDIPFLILVMKSWHLGLKLL